MDINELFDGIAEAFRQYQRKWQSSRRLQPTRFLPDLSPKGNLKNRENDSGREGS